MRCNMAERRQALPGAGSPRSLGAKPTPPLTRHPSREGIGEGVGGKSPPWRGGPTGRGGFPRIAGWIFRAARQFLRNTRGAAALESAIGAVVLVTASTLAFDLYTRATAPMTGLNAAVTVAEYVSREANPQAAEIAALATFLHREFFPQADAAFVVVAVQGSADQNQKWTWTKQILVDSSAADLDECSKVAGESNKATPPAALKLEAGEIVVVAEVCVKHGDEVSYAHHILPTRSDTVPAEPS